MKRTLLIMFGLVAACTFTACAAAPPASTAVSTATPTKAPTETATPSVTEPPASAEAGAPTRIVITAETVSLVSADDTRIESFTYFQPTESLVAGLTEAFGEAPTASRYLDTDSIDYEWDGFKVLTDGAGNPPYAVASVVGASKSTVYGLTVETVDGIHIGDDAAALEAAHSDSASRWMYQGVERLDISVGTIALDSTGNKTFAVKITALPADGELTEFFAPHKNFE